MSSAADAIGQRVTVTADAIQAEGMDCADWALTASDAAPQFAADPILTDVHIGPGDGPNSNGDARLGQAFALSCEGQYLSTLYRADDRVTVATLRNETLYVVLERILSQPELERLQAALIDTKFLSGPASGNMDSATREAVRNWYIYRQPDREAAIPATPALTRNLMDGMGVWHD